MPTHVMSLMCLPWCVHRFAGTGISRWYTESQWGMAQVTLARDTAFIAAFDHSCALHGEVNQRVIVEQVLQ